MTICVRTNTIFKIRLFSKTAGAKLYYEIENHLKVINKFSCSPAPILKKAINAIESKVFNLSAYFRRKKKEILKERERVDGIFDIGAL